MGEYLYGSPARSMAIAGHDDHHSDTSWILPISPAPAPQRTPAQREADTTAWERYVSDETQARIMTLARVQARADARRRFVIRMFCALLSVGLLIFGLSGMLAAGVDIQRHGLELAALVMGGGMLVAFVFAMTES